MSGGSIHFGVWKYEDEVFAIDRDDLFFDESTTPVKIFKRDPKDTFNRIVVKWTDVDKDSGYSYAIANDAVDQRITGQVRRRGYNLTGIVDADLATKTAYRLLAESMYRYKTYNFTLAYRSMTVEVGDVGRVSDGYEIYRERIRITRITEDEDGKRLNIEAIEEKDYLYLSPDQSYASNLHTRFVYPDLVSPAVYFTEDRLDSIVNLHICPQDQYFNGFIVYYSFDNSTYDYAGMCTVDSASCNLDGETVGTLGAHTAVIYKPKETIELSTVVDFASLQSMSEALFFNNQSLMKIDEEVIAYKTVAAAGDNDDVSCLIRGLFNTEPVAHSAAETWHTLGIDFKFNFTVDDIGKTVYFKVLTHYGPKMQQLADVSPTTHVITGEYVRPAPVSLIRMRDREGWSDFVTADFFVDFYFASKTSGFNIGSIDSQVWDGFMPDSSIQKLQSTVKDTSDVELHQEIYELDYYPVLVYSILIEEADRDAETTVKIEQTPVTSMVSGEAREITVVDKVP